MFDQRNPAVLFFDVLITSYEMVLQDAEFLCMLPFTFGVVDEAHRLKVYQFVQLIAFEISCCFSFPFHLLLLLAEHSISTGAVSANRIQAESLAAPDWNAVSKLGAGALRIAALCGA